MERDRDAALREHVVLLLDGGKAHARAEEVLAGFPDARCDVRLPGVAHTAWELLEHLRIAQEDIFRFCGEPDHVSPEWPEGYWPKEESRGRFRASAERFLADLERCIAIARDRNVDLLADLPHVQGVTWLQELLLVADHDAWHLGQLMQVRRALEAR